LVFLIEFKFNGIFFVANPRNDDIFHDQWQRGQPIIVSNILDRLDQNLWLPQAFSEEFGHLRSGEFFELLTKFFFFNCFLGIFNCLLGIFTKISPFLIHSRPHQLYERQLGAKPANISILGRL
jgi:hypothetical protein